MKKIIEIKFGSHLYGTATENSDIDIRGIYLPEVKDIILSRAKKSISNKITKTIGEKNKAGEVDAEYYSLQQYCHFLSEGQTVALDMLFAPPSHWLTTSSIPWDWIINNKHLFISKQYASFIGYCRRQANKYGIKGSRVAAAKKALELLNYWGGSNKNAPLQELSNFLKDICEGEEFINIVPLRQPNGQEILAWEVCGRKMLFTAPIRLALECLENLVKEYGSRSVEAANNEGVDWKALSHAVRIGHQAIELLKTAHITFPLLNARHILDIKQGKLTYNEVATEIETLLLQVEEASEKSSLPEKPDFEAIEDFVYNVYLDHCTYHQDLKVCECNRIVINDTHATCVDCGKSESNNNLLLDVLAAKGL